MELSAEFVEAITGAFSNIVESGRTLEWLRWYKQLWSRKYKLQPDTLTPINQTFTYPIANKNLSITRCRISQTKEISLTWEAKVLVTKIVEINSKNVHPRITFTLIDLTKHRVSISLPFKWLIYFTKVLERWKSGHFVSVCRYER